MLLLFITILIVYTACVLFYARTTKEERDEMLKSPEMFP